MAVDSLPGESDAFTLLLTDALRDGPGSPAWQEAVTLINTSGGSQLRSSALVDEYQLLCRAREHLESGKQFRSIRPGPAFTRQVIASIESKHTSPSFWSARWLLIAAAALLVVVGVAVVLTKIGPRSASEDPEVKELAGTLFGVSHASLDSESRLGSDWKSIGVLPVRFDRGFQLVPSNRESLPAAGGVALGAPIAMAQPFAIEAKLNVGRLSDYQMPEIVVSDTDDFSRQMATSSHEFVWALQGKLAKVILPDGRLAAQDEIRPNARGDLSIRIRVGRRVAIVEMNGHSFWLGAIGLSETTPRFVAIRVIRRASAGTANIVFPSIQVLTAQ